MKNLLFIPLLCLVLSGCDCIESPREIINQEDAYSQALQGRTIKKVEGLRVDGYNTYAKIIFTDDSFIYLQAAKRHIHAYSISQPPLKEKE